MRWIASWLLAALAACVPPPEVTGEVRFAQGVPVPASGELRVVLQDVSRADAPAGLLGEVVLTPPFGNPADFRIAYDAAKIDERNTYAVRATLRDGDRLLQTTDTVVPVITRGSPQKATLQMIAVASAPRLQAQTIRGEVFDRDGRLVLVQCEDRREIQLAQGDPAEALRARLDREAAKQGVGMLTEFTLLPADAQGDFGILRFETFPAETCGSPGVTAELLDNYFVATRIGGRPVPRTMPRDAHLVLHSAAQRVKGSSGCRRFEGGYVLQDASLRFEDIVVEAPTCGEASATQDSRLIEALTAVRTWRLTGIHLELFGERGEPLARLESRPLR